MLSNAIDRPVVRLVLGVLIGFPLSVVALFAAPHGLILGYAGVAEGSPLLIFAGLMTVLGVIAIFGAWYRLFVPHVEMGIAQARGIRFCLYCGVISSFGLAAWAGYERQFLLASALGLFVIAGVVLVKGTPIPNAL
jgi:hypothetical protein